MRTTSAITVTLAAVLLTSCTSTDTDPVTAEVQSICHDWGFVPGDTGDYVAPPPWQTLTQADKLTDRASAAAKKNDRWWPLTQDLNGILKVVDHYKKSMGPVDPEPDLSTADQQGLVDLVNKMHGECNAAYDAG